MNIKGEIMACDTTGNMDNDMLFQTIAFDFLDICDDEDTEEIEDTNTEAAVYIESRTFKYIGNADVQIFYDNDRVKIKLTASDISFSIDITDHNLVIVLNNDDETKVDRYVVIITADTKIIMEQSVNFDL